MTSILFLFNISYLTESRKHTGIDIIYYEYFIQYEEYILLSCKMI